MVPVTVCPPARLADTTSRAPNKNHARFLMLIMVPPPWGGGRFAASRRSCARSVRSRAGRALAPTMFSIEFARTAAPPHVHPVRQWKHAQWSTPDGDTGPWECHQNLQRLRLLVLDVRHRARHSTRLPP